MLRVIRTSFLAILCLNNVALAAQLSPAQTSWYSARLAAHERGQFSSTPTSPSATLLPEPLAEKLVTWDRIRRSAADASFGEVYGFLQANPGWPGQPTLQRRAEEALAADDKGEVNAATRQRYFQQFPATTPQGQLVHALALQAGGDSAQSALAASLARAAWTDGGLDDSAAEATLLANFGSAIRPEDDVARANALLWRGKTSAATRLLPRLPKQYRALAEMRIGLQQVSRGIMARIDREMPGELRNDPGFIHDLARYQRRSLNADAAAVSTFRNAGAVPGSGILDARKWAAERDILAARERRAGRAQIAYRLVAEHQLGLTPQEVADMPLATRVAYTDLEWEAGWLALQFLRQPDKAVGHFRAVFGAGTHPITRSRAAYWLGRSYEAAGDIASARQWYGQAAVNDLHFYGQLSREKLGLSAYAGAGSGVGATALSAAPTPSDSAAFAADERVRAIALLGELDAHELQTSFFSHLANSARSGAQKALLADLAQQVARPDLSVMIGKLAEQRGFALDQAAYPSIALPGSAAQDWTIVHAISRQESLFNTRAISRVGARGLMQLMPATAQQVARQSGLTYSSSRLTSDPAYNLALGSSYFRSLLNQYNGNHIMAVAAYNAGPGRVRQWVAQSGDPRDVTVDVIDWIESIPFSETRSYVQRVLENAVVYSRIRARQDEAAGGNSASIAAPHPDQIPLSRYLGRSVVPLAPAAR